MIFNLTVKIIPNIGIKVLRKKDFIKIPKITFVKKKEHFSPPFL